MGEDPGSGYVLQPRDQEGLNIGRAAGNVILGPGGSVDDESGCARCDCPQLDYDGDGAVNEDPIDGWDNDGDGVIDEAPIERPNLFIGFPG